MKRGASELQAEHLKVETSVNKKRKSTKDTSAKGSKLAKSRGNRRDAVVNQRRDNTLKVFVFSENSTGELGIGSKGRVLNIKHPLLNPLLQDRRVVDIAVGGMHQVFLTADGKILACGVNDEGALGRNSVEGSGDDDGDDDDDDDNGLNRLEARPMEMDTANVPGGTMFTGIAAGDSVTFVTTADGLVYGCGTFRSNKGVLGFTAKVTIQHALTRVQGLKNVKKVICGTNHALALTHDGDVLAWGSGQQRQLGRLVGERSLKAGLTPGKLGLPRGKIVEIGSGAFHSFAIDDEDRVWAWGLNSYCQCGIEDAAGEDNAIVNQATIVSQLSRRGITQIDGGNHHSLALASDNEALVWGRTDGFQVGIDISKIGDAGLIRDEDGKPRILKKATVVQEIRSAVYVAAGSDQSFIINAEGRAFASGFSVNYQTGLGTTDDIERFTMLDSKSVKDETLIFVGAGGQYGVLASVARTNSMQA